VPIGEDGQPLRTVDAAGQAVDAGTILTA
jgi:hypothetical protein